MKLKMYTTENFFDKICVKAIRDAFFQYGVCNQGREGVRHEGKGEDLSFWWGQTEE